MCGSCDMQVLQVQYDNWGEEHDPKSDWSLSKKYADFYHRIGTHEFIFYIEGSDNICSDFFLQEYKEQGFSETFLSVCKEAQRRGYRYVCLYV